MRCTFRQIVGELDRLSAVVGGGSTLPGEPARAQTPSGFAAPTSVSGNTDSDYTGQAYLAPMMELADEGRTAQGWQAGSGSPYHRSYLIPMGAMRSGREMDETHAAEAGQQTTHSYANVSSQNKNLYV